MRLVLASAVGVAVGGAVGSVVSLALDRIWAAPGVSSDYRFVALLFAVGAGGFVYAEAKRRSLRPVLVALAFTVPTLYVGGLGMIAWLLSWAFGGGVDDVVAAAIARLLLLFAVAAASSIVLAVACVLLGRAAGPGASTPHAALRLRR